MTKSSAILEIIVMLLGAAILGFILAWLIFKDKKEHSYSSATDTNEEIERLKKKNNDLMIELGNAKRSNTDLSIKLDECNKRGQSISIKNTESAQKNTENIVNQNISKAALANIKPEKSDLKIIEGIGPKIEELLNNGNIYSFSDLSNSNYETLKEILTKAGSRFQMHDPKTWPQQAALARDGKMEELKKLQDELNAGRS